MPLDAFIAVLVAALLHASWNALMRGRAGDPLTSAFVVAAGSAAIGIPLLFVTGLPAQAAWVYVLASAVIHVPYFIVVGLAYRATDFSVAYPLMRGGAPLVTAFFGALLVGEGLSGITWLGLVLLSAGIVALSSGALRLGRLDLHGAAIIASAVAVIVSYTLIDGLGARASGNPAGYVVATTALGGLITLPIGFLLQGRGLAAALKARWPVGVGAGAMAMLSYGIALWAMTRMPIGVVAAVRETSVLFGTILAALFLGERFGLARCLAAAAIVAGLMLVQLG